MDWKKYFDDIILDRGFKYYKQGKVGEYNYNGSECSASVYGSDEYSVKIIFENGDIKNVKCSCPYAAEGNYCKHMAAVLFYMENGEPPMKKKIIRKALNSDTEKNEEDEKIKTADFINNHLPESIEYFVTKLSENNELFKKFKKSVAPDETDFDLKAEKKTADAIISSYRHSGFIDYPDAYPCAAELCDFVEQECEILFNCKKYYDAFELAFHVYTAFLNTEMDDSDGGIALLSDSCYDVWEKSVSCSENTKDRFFKKALDCYSKREKFTYDIDAVERFIFNCFNEESYTLILIKITDSDITEAEKDEYGGYKVNELLSRRLILMERIRCADEDYEKIIKEYWNYESVELHYINECLFQNNYDEAIRILKELRNLPKKNGLEKERCSEMLMDIYQQTGNTAEYRKELNDYVFSRACTIEWIYKLKNEYRETEWAEKRSEIEKYLKKSNNSYLPELLAKEGQIDELFDYVININGTYLLDEYENLLKEKYEEEILKKRIECIDGEASYTSDRKKYKEIVRKLRLIAANYGNGQNEICKLIIKWRVEYKSRRAMMEELNKIII